MASTSVTDCSSLTGGWISTPVASSTFSWRSRRAPEVRTDHLNAVLGEVAKEPMFRVVRRRDDLEGVAGEVDRITRHQPGVDRLGHVVGVGGGEHVRGCTLGELGDQVGGTREAENAFVPGLSFFICASSVNVHFSDAAANTVISPVMLVGDDDALAVVVEAVSVFVAEQLATSAAAASAATATARMGF